MHTTTTRVARRRLRVVIAFAALSVTAVAASCAPPGAGPDKDEPTLTVSAAAEFVVGSQITTATATPPDTQATTGFSSGIEARVAWTSNDARSGICGHDVERVYAGTGPGLVLDNSLDTEYLDSETDYDDQFGGGSFKVVGWNVTARDCAGNSTTKYVDGGPIVIQEDGTTVGYGDNAPTYTGTWGTSKCACWSGGKVARTTAAGATVSHAVGGRDGRVALVMEQGPARGQFSVAVNGVEQAIVDNGLVPSPRQRVVVWESAVRADDVVTVTNLATPGRARIDLDAIIVR